MPASQKKTILVTGSNGQLGSELNVLSQQFPSYNFLFATRSELPLDDADRISAYFKSQQIDYCVNCAAYTAVDKAETETELANQVNGDAVGLMAQLCNEKGAPFIHISTDYVFDGTAQNPYPVSFPTKPVNAYGASKLKGEELAMTHNPASIIIRTSWVYSCFGNNFVKTMMRLMRERESINVVNDQQGCPTYAADLAKAILQIIVQIDQNPSALRQYSGIYHYSNAGIINWYEFALAINEIMHSICKVHPIPSSAYPTPAKRPQYSVMDTTKIQSTFHIQIPAWKDSLKKCMGLMLGGS